MNIGYANDSGAGLAWWSIGELAVFLSPPARRGAIFAGITGYQGTTYLAALSAGTGLTMAVDVCLFAWREAARA
jgi:hypothetical protein